MNPTTTRWVRRSAIGAAAIMLFAFAVGTLYSPRDDARAPRDATTSVGSAPVSRNGAADVAGSGSGATVKVRPATIPSLGDRIARSADITLEVREGSFDRAWQRVYSIATSFGGRVMSATRGDRRPIVLEDGKRFAFGDITIRVPTDRFEAATNALRELGEVTGDSSSAEDVTQEFVDLNSRLRALRAEESVLLRLMARAKTISDTLQIQTRLSDVQTQIEEITGRVRYLEARTDFSTITLHMAEPGAATAPPGDEPSFVKAWDTALEGLVRIGTVAMIASIWMIPFAILVAIVLGLMRRGRPPADTPAA